MIETIALIVSVATGILSCMGTIKGMKAERKTTVSAFFTDIANTIDEAVVKFRNNEVPHGACDRMRRYALELPTALDGHIDAQKLQKYADELYEAHEIEQLNITIQQHPEKLIDLEKAASAFRVAANIIKLTK